MKKLILGALAFVAGLALACVGNRGDSPVQVLGAHPPNDSCEVNDTVQSGTKTIDLSGARALGDQGAGNINPYVFFELKSELATTETVQNGNTLSDPSRNGAYIDEVQLSYQTSGGTSITFQDETYPIAGFVPAGDSLFMPTDLIGDKAAQKLLDSSSPGSPPFNVLVNVKFRGYTAGSTGGTFLTNDVIVPVKVFDTSAGAGARPIFDVCGSVIGSIPAGGDAGTP